MVVRIACVGGIAVSIVAFQAIDPGSIPRQLALTNFISVFRIATENTRSLDSLPTVLLGCLFPPSSHTLSGKPSIMHKTDRVVHLN